MTEFRVQRVIAKPVAEVWTAFTDPEALRAWFWPPAWQTEVEIDLRVGGGFRIAAPSKELAVSGVYREIEAPGRLVHTWRWDGDDDETLVTMTFVEVTGGTGITILHERFASAEDAAGNEQGWLSCLDRLGPPVDQDVAR
jgi:uncharacterized protein YndB with AHSA1/START domain